MHKFRIILGVALTGLILLACNSTTGSIVGGTSGSIVGGILGSQISNNPIGSIAGSIAGSYAGSVAGSNIGSGKAFKSKKKKNNRQQDMNGVLQSDSLSGRGTDEIYH